MKKKIPHKIAMFKGDLRVFIYPCEAENYKAAGWTRTKAAAQKAED